MCGCQKTEKTIYKVPLSEHAMELKRQERAYNDSLEMSDEPENDLPAQAYPPHTRSIRLTSSPFDADTSSFIAKLTAAQRHLQSQEGDHCSKGGCAIMRHNPLWSERGDSNARPLRPERSALPTALLSECGGKDTTILLKTEKERHIFCPFLVVPCIWIHPVPCGIGTVAQPPKSAPKSSCEPPKLPC